MKEETTADLVILAGFKNLRKYIKSEVKIYCNQIEQTPRRIQAISDNSFRGRRITINIKMLWNT